MAASDPERAFVVSAAGTLTYGDVAASGDPPGGGRQLVVVPGAEPASIVAMASALKGGRQLVVVEPNLSGREHRRRVRAAEAAIDRDAATILFTSGTSGPPRAVRLTVANWSAAAEASATHLDHGPDDVWLAAMPLHHVGGLAILLRSAFVGGAVHWIPRFDVPEVVKALRGGVVTMASLVPTMLRRILDHDTGSFPNLKAVLIGGAAIPGGLLEEAHQRGLPALPTYGMTETCAQVATLRPGSPPRRAAHVLPGVEVRIGDQDRIRVRGPQVSPGYAHEDDRLPGEWFVTPDRGELAIDGTLRVLGRVDDVIVTGGENVDPLRVEAELARHGGVTAVAVVGLPDDEWGEMVAAAYEGTVDAETLRHWARRHLAPYEVPRRFLRLDRLPVIGPGKPDRAAVKSLLTPSR